MAAQRRMMAQRKMKKYHLWMKEAACIISEIMAIVTISCIYLICENQ